MGNLTNTNDQEMLGSNEVITVSFVDRDGNLLATQDYAKGSIDEARHIPKGNRIPYVAHPEWRLHDISEDGKTWTIDIVH